MDDPLRDELLLFDRGISLFLNSYDGLKSDVKYELFVCKSD